MDREGIEDLWIQSVIRENKGPGVFQNGQGKQRVVEKKEIQKVIKRMGLVEIGTKVFFKDLHFFKVLLN